MAFASFPNTGDSARHTLHGSQESCARVHGPCVLRVSGPGTVSVAEIVEETAAAPKVLKADGTFDVKDGQLVEVWVNGSGDASVHVDRSAPGDGVKAKEIPAEEPAPEPEAPVDRKVLVHEGSQSRHISADELVASAKPRKRSAKKTTSRRKS